MQSVFTEGNCCFLKKEGRIPVPYSMLGGTFIVMLDGCRIIKYTRSLIGATLGSIEFRGCPGER
jgi:hypothetical protein